MIEILFLLSLLFFFNIKFFLKMTRIADELIEKEGFGFANLNLNPSFSKKKIGKNKNANGIHKYMKLYLKMYNWRDREKFIIQYTNNKINPINNKPISKMKQRCACIQNNFDEFVKFLKQNTNKK